MVLDRVILTGASGMFGKHMSARLNSIGTEVIQVTSKKKKNFVKWNLEKWLSNKDMDQKFGNASAIIHAGAVLPNTTCKTNNSKIFDVNIRSCANFAEWALYRSIPIIFISSGSVYLNPFNNLIKEDDLLGTNNLGGIYGMSKILAENVLNQYKSKGLKVSILRPSSLYGFGMRNKNIINKFLSLSDRGDTLEIYEPINDCIDFLHASDLSSAVLKVLETECWETFNISFGRLFTISELAKTCIDIVGNGSIKIINKKKKNFKKSTQTFALDNRKAISQLDWAPKIDIKKGLELVHLKSIDFKK